ncbi:hypothetical protein GCM10018954_018540 [Kutzneria kofuensis]
MKPHAGKDVHVVLDNLSPHTRRRSWPGWPTTRTCGFTSLPKVGTFSSVKVLVTQIREYIAHWNATATPFVWTATAEEILAKVRLVQVNVKKLVDNSAK